MRARSRGSARRAASTQRRRSRTAASTSARPTGRSTPSARRAATLRWSTSTGGYVYSSTAVWHDRVYAGSYSHGFYCFDAATGRVLWRFAADGPDVRLADDHRRPRVLRDARRDDLRAGRAHRASGSGRSPTGSTRRWSPTAPTSTWSATRRFTGSLARAPGTLHALMRYVVTGAAGFIGSHLAAALLARGSRGRRVRLLHRLLRPGAEGGERPLAVDVRSADRPGRGPARLLGASTASSTWPASPGCAASATSSRCTSGATCLPRSASSRPQRVTA